MNQQESGSPEMQALAQDPATSVFKEKPVTYTLGIAVILVIMNTMMFNLALPKVAEQFSLSPSTVSWIVTGYSIVFAMSSITFSRLSDFVPIRTLFTAALVSVGTGSLLGMFSEGFGLLLAARLIQAAGAGAIPALGIVLLTRYIPQSRRGRSMSIILSASSLGLGLGPVIGGSVVQYLGWHFLFVITGVMLLFIPVFLLMLPKEKASSGTFDFIGALLVGAGTTGLLLFLTSKSIIALLAGLLALFLFSLRIRAAADPFVQPSLFRNRAYMSLGAVGIGTYMINFTFLFIAPQMLSRVYGLDPGVSGLVMFPGALTAMFVSNQVGRWIDRYGNGVILRYVPWLLLVSIVCLALTSIYSYYAIAFIYVFTSISFTAISSAVSNEMSRLLPKEHIGSGMGLFQLLQFFSGAFGVALSGTALVWQHALPEVHAFGNIIWGMTLAAILAITCVFMYRKYTSSLDSAPNL
ncbi:MFS transporter [Paenibacillus gansuensis]|uniref:MFS transporter n=1 Tax=Paenibacillus gansuensis TaxID=306542 RepID=A0ABW5PJK8_9BACL